MDIQRKKGLLDVCVLAVLRRGDSYGYKIVQDLQQVVEMSESTLYPILRRLEAQRCVSTYTSAHNGRLRKYYSLAAEGRRKISEFTDEWGEVMRIYRFIAEDMV